MDFFVEAFRAGAPLWEKATTEQHSTPRKKQAKTAGIVRFKTARHPTRRGKLAGSECLTLQGWGLKRF